MLRDRSPQRIARLALVGVLTVSSGALASPESIADTLAKVLSFDRNLAGAAPALLLVVGSGEEAAHAPLRDALIAAGLATETTTEEELGSRLPTANVVFFTGEVAARAADTVRGFGVLSLSADPALADSGAVSLALDDSTAAPQIVINLVRLEEEGHSFPAALLGRSRVVRTSELASQSPRLLHFDVPDYPERARRLRVEGTAILRLAIDAAGTVQNVDLLQGVSRLAGVDEAALRSARGARVAPARRQGQPIDGWLIVRVPFRLAG